MDGVIRSVKWKVVGLACLLLTVRAWSQDCVPAPAGLVAWWAGEVDAKDTVNGNNGSLQGGASFSAGKVGYAFDFDGTNGTVVVPDSSSLDLTNQLTIEAWINTSLTNFTQFTQAVVSKVSIMRGDHGYQLVLVGNELAGQFNGPGQPWPSYFLKCPVPIIPGTWNHVAWTYDQSAMRLYFNGGLLATRTIGPQVIAITAAEIQAIYQAGSAGKCVAPRSATRQ